MTSAGNVEFYMTVCGKTRAEAEAIDAVRPDLVPVSSEEADQILAQLDDVE